MGQALQIGRRLAVVGLVLVSSRAPLYGQDAGPNPWFVRTGITPAYVLSPNPFSATSYASNDPIHWAPDLTIEIGRQTDGTRDWHEAYGMPSYGFGFSLVSFGNQQAAGRPLEAYGFFSWPFAQLTDRIALTTDFGTGLSWRWTQKSQQGGPEETVLGSDLNARIDWGFYLRYATTPRMTVYTGVAYTHRSNGGTEQPNLGINVIGPRMTVQYSFANDVRRHHDVSPPAFRPAWELVIGGAQGTKNVVERTSPMVRADFRAMGVTAALQRQFYPFGKIAAGGDLMYDGSTGATLDDRGSEWRAAPGQRWAVGVYGGYEHIIGRFSAILQVGHVVARGFDNPEASQFYTRYGWRYHVSDRVWGTLAIRASQMRKADALEFGVGYRTRLGGK